MVRKVRTEFVWSSELPVMMTTKEVALFLRVHQSTVVRWRQTGEGPPVVWVSPTIPRYVQSQLVQWLRAAA